MSKFSTQLQVVLERLKISQREAAKEMGIPASLFHRYYRGTFRPKPEVLEKICRILNDPERAELVVAHLRDETPESARDLVRIMNLFADARIEGEPDYAYRVDLPEATRQAFDLLMTLARDDQDVADWIKGTAKILREK